MRRPLLFQRTGKPRRIKRDSFGTEGIGKKNRTDVPTVIQTPGRSPTARSLSVTVSKRTVARVANRLGFKRRDWCRGFERQVETRGLQPVRMRVLGSET